MNTKDNIVAGVVIDETAVFTLGDLCRRCDVHAEIVVEMVTEGILEPQGNDPTRWRFSGPALRRVRTALRLQRDLEVNLAGAALVLDLLDELRDLRRLVQQYEQQPNDDS